MTQFTWYRKNCSYCETAWLKWVLLWPRRTQNTSCLMVHIWTVIYCCLWAEFVSPVQTNFCCSASDVAWNVCPHNDFWTLLAVFCLMINAVGFLWIQRREIFYPVVRREHQYWTMLQKTLNYAQSKLFYFQCQLLQKSFLKAAVVCSRVMDDHGHTHPPIRLM